MMKTTKRVLSGIFWLGRGVAAMMGLAVILAVVLGVATSALAGTGVGATFNLGQTNTVDALSRLVGSTNDALLRIDNDDAGASATALELRVEPGQAPMKVDSSTKVQTLNADEVDGKSASAFLGTDDKAADAAHADTADHADKASGATFADQADQAELADKADDATHAIQADRATRAANANKVEGLHADEIGVNGWLREEEESASNSVSPKSVTVHCPSGKVVVGTGYDIVGGKNDPGKETDVVVDEVTPLKTNVEVTAIEETRNGADWSVYAFAVCAQASF